MKALNFVFPEKITGEFSPGFYHCKKHSFVAKVEIFRGGYAMVRIFKKEKWHTFPCERFSSVHSALKFALKTHKKI